MLNHKIKTTPRLHSALDFFAEAANDANGNLLQRTDNLLSTRFAYDNLERLDTALGIFGSRDYTLDKNGNRTQLQIGATTTTYNYRPASNVMTNFNGTGVMVDQVGNTTTLRGMTLTYDTLNRLKTINGASYTYNAFNQRTSKIVNGITTNYIYGLSGELLAELNSAGGTQVQYVYHHGQPLSIIKRETITPPPPPADVIIDNGAPGTTLSSGWTSSTNAQDYGANYRYTAASTTLRWHRWTPTIPRAGRYEVFAWYVTNTGNSTTAPYTIVHNGITNVVTLNQRLNGGRWMSLGQHDFAVTATGTPTQYIELTNRNGRVTADAIKLVYIPAATVPTTQTNVYYIHNDHLGTPRAMTDATKKVVWRWDSDPFGATAANEDPDGDSIKVTMNLRFPGQYFDAESGLHFNWNRYYDPPSGRYITSDPIGLAGGLNTFGYVYGNPIGYVDPEGLAGWWRNKVIYPACLAMGICNAAAKAAEGLPTPKIPGPTREQVEKIEEIKKRSNKQSKKQEDDASKLCLLVDPIGMAAEVSYWACLGGDFGSCGTYYDITGHTVMHEVIDRGGEECYTLGLCI